MSEILTQNELANRLVEKTGVSIEVAKKFAKVFFSIVRTGLKNTDRFSVYNFGTFKKTWIEKSTGINPFNGEELEIPAHWRIKFIPCASVARRINHPYAHLKPKVLKENKISEGGLFAKACKIAEKGDDCPTVVSDGFYTSIPEPTVLKDDELKSIEKQSSEEKTSCDEQNTDKSKKKIIIISCCSLLFILLIFVFSLLFRNCVSKKISVEKEVPETKIEVVDSILEEKEETQKIEEIDEVEENLSFYDYTVQQGQSYHKIAEQKFGDRHLWPLIYSANKDKSIDPDFIPVYETIKIPDFLPENSNFEKKQIDSAVLDAYNGYLLMTEKEPDSDKNYERKQRAIRVIVSGELLNPGFIESNKSRILPEYVELAKNIVVHQYK